MINTIKNILEVNRTMNLNMYIYYLRRLKIFKNLKKTKLLTIIFEIVKIITKLSTNILSKIIYVSVIYIISKFINKINIENTFTHIFIFFTFIGMFINSRITQTNKQKYYNIILLNMNAKHYLLYTGLLHIIETAITNLAVLSIFFIKNNFSLKMPIILTIIVILSKITGDYLSLLYYNKNKKTIITSTKLYFLILLSLLSLSILPPIFKITLTEKIVQYIIFILLILALIGIIYIIDYKDYRLMYKRILSKDFQEIKNLKRESLVEISDKDYEISSKNIDEKDAYSYLNKIFFRRHKSIIAKPIITYCIVITIIAIFLIIYSFTHNNILKEIQQQILYFFPWIAIILYLLNKGALITQAMFINCDRKMLKYNFYREEESIEKMFINRLKETCKINILPSILICISITILLIPNNYLPISYILLLDLTILSLTMFFSVYYITAYYLLQPYDSNMKITNIKYYLINIMIYIIGIQLARLKIELKLFTLGIIISTTILSIILVLLTKKYSRFTFKMKNV